VAVVNSEPVTNNEVRARMAPSMSRFQGRVNHVVSEETDAISPGA
jgi:hypothetical protein